MLAAFMTRLIPAARNRVYSTSAKAAQEDMLDEDMPEFDMQNPYTKEKKKCILCKLNVKVDYKNLKLLSQFVSPYTGLLYPKHITGLCEQQQLNVTRAVLTAKRVGMIPNYHKIPEYLRDPRLFDPFRPSRPNPH
ncbi:small ribosomal subunit protein bS18m-like [Ornithodoros turicata]|uniref:small ribosomal subunit protein bS18m-like n=1 Tax=Ornithodoros turicata TaxID=34597 RepID=UPI003138E8A3